jgi:hypothetical protein
MVVAPLLRNPAGSNPGDDTGATGLEWTTADR